MTTNTDIVNRALQAIGTRTTVTDAELAASSTNEAIQANIILAKTRDDLLRMAPWNCALFFRNLQLISAASGTPENSSPALNLWIPGLPPPPWLYEYQYPSDCLKACWIVPQFQGGFSGGVPITTAVTGGGPQYWNGPPVRFKVHIDRFFPVESAAVVAGGSGYAVGELITLNQTGDVPSDFPVGASPTLRVATVSAGAVLTVTIQNDVMDADPVVGGSYFERQTNPQAQVSSDGSGTGATFNLSYGSKSDQRVIVTNQESALMAYCRRVTDPNIMDSLFQTAWINVLGASLAMALTSDKATANRLVSLANAAIIEARKADGNEGLTVNDVTPDWLRIRGADYVGGVTQDGANGFDWGGLWQGW